MIPLPPRGSGYKRGTVPIDTLRFAWVNFGVFDGVSSPHLPRSWLHKRHTDLMSTGTRAGKPGRRSKGERERFSWRAPVEVKRAAEAKAQSLGIKCFNDYLTLLVATDAGIVIRTDPKEGLPFADVA